MLRLFSATLLALLWPFAAGAHDFFLASERSSLPGPGVVGIKFLVGHAGHYADWHGAPARLASLYAVDPSGKMTPQIAAGHSHARIGLGSAGTHMLVLESHPARSELAPPRFRRWISEAGLTLVRAHRAFTGTQDTVGRESYSRHAKLLLPVGESAGRQLSLPAGLELELVPQQDPWRLAPDEPLTVQLLYLAAPLAGATVRLESLSVAGYPRDAQVTDRDGRVAFELPRAGDWKISAVWSEPAADGGQADYRTRFTSLTFGY